MNEEQIRHIPPFHSVFDSGGIDLLHFEHLLGRVLQSCLFLRVNIHHTIVYTSFPFPLMNLRYDPHSPSLRFSFVWVNGFALGGIYNIGIWTWCWSCSQGGL